MFDYKSRSNNSCNRTQVDQHFWIPRWSVQRQQVNPRVKYVQLREGSQYRVIVEVDFDD
jgi:hypothetical protein